MWSTRAKDCVNDISVMYKTDFIWFLLGTVHYGCTCSPLHVHFAHNNLNNFTEQICPYSELSAYLKKAARCYHILFLRFSTIFLCNEDGTDCDTTQKHRCRKSDRNASLADFSIWPSSIRREKIFLPASMEEKYCSTVVLGRQQLRGVLQTRAKASKTTTQN